MFIGNSNQNSLKYESSYESTWNCIKYFTEFVISTWEHSGFSSKLSQIEKQINVLYIGVLRGNLLGTAQLYSAGLTFYMLEVKTPASPLIGPK